MVNMGLVDKVYQGFVDLDLLEDRREYGLDDYRTGYPELNEEECLVLYDMVQGEFDPTTTGAYGTLKDVPAELVKEYLEETLHGGCEGYPDGATAFFTLLRQDLMRYANAAAK